MLKEVTMYTVVCDNCGKSADEGSEYAAWGDPDSAEIVAMEYDWLRHEGKDYCDDCVQYNDEGNLVLRNVTQND